MVDANVEAISTEVEGGVGEDESHAISGRTLSEIACILRANSQFGEGHAAIQYADVDLWFGMRPKFGEGHAAIQYADVDLWFGIRSKFGEVHAAIQYANADLLFWIRPKF